MPQLPSSRSEVDTAGWWRTVTRLGGASTVALFDRRTEQEKAADAAAKAESDQRRAAGRAEADRVRTAEKEAADRVREAEKEAEQYLNTWPGRAAAAKARGDGFFQAQIHVSTLNGESSWGSASATFRRTDDHGDVLGEIEAQGWHLDHVGYVFVETGSVSSNRVLGTGQGTAMRGVVTGIYLFRNTDPRPTPS